MNLSLFLMSMFLTISLEAAAAFISAKARLSFRVVMSKPRALSKLSFRSRLLLRDISVFCLMSLDMWDTEDIGDTEDVFYTFGQGARGHTAVPDDCQYTTETLTVFCASHSQHSLAGAGSRECYVTRGHTDIEEWGALTVFMTTLAEQRIFMQNWGIPSKGCGRSRRSHSPCHDGLDGHKSHFRLNPRFRHFSFTFRLIKT